MVAADVNQDQKSGASYFLVRIAVSAEEISRLGGLQLVPGMPAEAYVQTSPRTVISFLVKPLRDQMTRAFREK
jgi:HlyD family secretion protein